jgi:hypothetical protein
LLGGWPPLAFRGETSAPILVQLSAPASAVGAAEISPARERGVGGIQRFQAPEVRNMSHTLAGGHENLLKGNVSSRGTQNLLSDFTLRKPPASAVGAAEISPARKRGVPGEQISQAPEVRHKSHAGHVPHPRVPRQRTPQESAGAAPFGFKGADFDFVVPHFSSQKKVLVLNHAAQRCSSLLRLRWTVRCAPFAKGAKRAAPGC